MNNTSPKPILVTGSHRSGSTWVGKMIALSPTIGYIHEPFNLNSDICKTTFDYWFTYICEENEDTYLNDINNCLHFKYKISKEVEAAHLLKDIARLVRDKIKYATYSLQQKRPLVKDPISILSAQWLACCFNMDVVVLIRHPAAFAGSLKKAGWAHPFNHFLQQPLLMQDHLQEYASEIQGFASSNKDIIDQAILLWNVIHHMILKYIKNHSHDWIFVRHEDLSRSPLEEFGKLYKKLDLVFSKEIKQKLKEFSFAAGNEKDNYLKRNSKVNIWSWKNRLTKSEILRIKEGTDKVAGEFYTEADWTL